MKKGGIYTGYVESVDFPNKGNVIVKTEEDGQIIKEKAVVKNSIPGQTVKFMVNKKKHGKCAGRLLELSVRQIQKLTKDVSILVNVVAAYIRL